MISLIIVQTYFVTLLGRPLLGRVATIFNVSAFFTVELLTPYILEMVFKSFKD